MLHRSMNGFAKVLGILAAVLLLMGPGAMSMASPMDGMTLAGAMHCDDCGDAPTAAMAAGACVAPCPGTMLPAFSRVARSSDDGHAPAAAFVDRAGTGRAVAPDPVPPKLPA